MTVEQWEIVVGVVTSALLGLAPWMFMVHAKLAVIAAQIATISQQLAKSSETHHELWSMLADHQARLETHDVHLGHLAQHLDNLL